MRIEARVDAVAAIDTVAAIGAVDAVGAVIAGGDRAAIVAVLLLRQLGDVAGLEHVQAAVGGGDLVLDAGLLLDDDALPDAAVGRLDDVDVLEGLDIDLRVVGVSASSEQGSEDERREQDVVE